MTAVFVIRHPQTSWNEESRYQGRLESPLSDAGKAQAETLARAFARGELDAVVSSPLARAMHLAAALSRATGAPLLCDHRLTEMAQGPWEGLKLAEIRDRYPDLYREWYSRPEIVTFPGGENLRGVRTRAISALSAVMSRYPSGRVALVTHSVVVKVLTAAALGLGLGQIHRFAVGNAGVTTLCGTSAPGWLLTLNNTQPIYGSPIHAAEAAGCGTATGERSTT